MIWIILAGIGAVAGAAAGLFGIGGGLLIVPALLWLLKFPMHLASATSLVALMIPLSAMIAVYNYYASGKLTKEYILYGLMICAGMAFGAFIGSKIAIDMDATTLRKSFAVFLAFVAVLTWFKR